MKMRNQNNTIVDEKMIEGVEEALKNGDFSKAYEEIQKRRISITQNQARKLLELTRGIKTESNKKTMTNKIIRILMYLEYQNKRGQIREAYELYKKVFEKAYELCKQNGADNLGENLYRLIEILTIHLYERRKK